MLETGRVGKAVGGGVKVGTADAKGLFYEFPCLGNLVRGKGYGVVMFVDTLMPQ